MRVLVVEDSAAQRLVVVRMLIALGHQVTEAACAEQALALTDRFDVVVADYGLPGLSGAAWVAALRQKVGDALIVVASASPLVIDGPDVVVMKPVTRTVLAQALTGQQAGAVAVAHLLDAGHIAQLRADLGRDRLMGLITRFVDEADAVFAGAECDALTLHHLAGSAALFGAHRLHAAVLQGNGAAVWPATRRALLAFLDQAV